MMNTTTWPQVQEMALGGGMKNIQNEIMVSSASCSPRPMLQEIRKARPNKEKALNCPRCNSSNTKFCYYNNYSDSQPRYFCKACRRYWTEGGSLRNIPFGGGSRKNKRSMAKKFSDIVANPSSNSFDQSSLLCQSNHGAKDHLDLGMLPTMNQTGQPTSDLFDHGKLLTRSFTMGSSLVPFQDSNDQYYGTSGFGMDDFKGLHCVDYGFSGHGSLQGVANGDQKLGFSFEDVKPATAQQQHLDFDHSRAQIEATGSYWGGILGGAPWPQVPNYGL